MKTPFLELLKLEGRGSFQILAEYAGLDYQRMNTLFRKIRRGGAIDDRTRDILTFAYNQAFTKSITIDDIEF